MTRPHSRTTAPLPLLLAAVLLAGCGGAASSAAPAAAPPVSSAVPAPGPTPTPTGLLDSAPATLGDLRTLQALRPVAVQVPGEDSAPVEAFTTDPVGGGLALPDDAATVAWYASGASPGEDSGTVVLAAHVSYQGATGPFTELEGAAPGAAVAVTSADGTVRQYTISDVRQAPQTAPDRAALFAAGGPPRLVLVTCGGQFDPVTRSFASNTVVTALPA